MLATDPVRLTERYDLAMLDLDGVVYIGGAAVAGAPEHLRRARSSGLRAAFITNNASRPPGVVAAHLVELGVEADRLDVVTSAQAAARVLVDDYGPGAPIVLLGGPGLEAALDEVGLVPVGVGDPAVAVVSGYGPEVLWRDIMQVAMRVRDGLPWVASNADGSLPTPTGVAPGHGVLVETIARFAGVVPRIAGKPERPLLDETIRRMGSERPLMVGDRLDTDIEGARNAGVDSLLVLTGVTGLPELVAAPPALRPTYVARDLGGLFTPHSAPEVIGGEVLLGGWRGTVADGCLRVTGTGAADGWWQVAAATAWWHADRHARIIDIAGLVVPDYVAVGR